MAHPTPHVEQGTLTLKEPDAEHMIAVGTSAWFTWLEKATAFTFACVHGTFTARREHSSSGRGAWYWRAYQHRAGTRRRAYLGKAAELSLERLHTVTAHLANLKDLARPQPIFQYVSADLPAGFIAAFTGSNRFVVDYLADEVLSRQPAHIQTFLLRTSILARMCGPLCDAVLGVGGWGSGHGENGPTPNPQAYSQLLLEQLERANLFVTPLDAERRWYRYHHLFAEVLHERLRRGAAPAAVAALHQRASAWYAQNGSVPDAIQHALAAEAPDVAAQLIEAHGQSLIARGELLSLTRWLRLLPDTTLRARPRLLLLLAWLLPHTGALADAARYRAEAESLLADNPDPVLRSEFLALQLQPLLYQERTGEVIAFGRQVLEHLPAEHFFRCGSGVVTGLALIRQSQLAEAERILSVAVAEARDKQALFFLVAGLARLAIIAAERGDFTQAEQFYSES